jgi:hypothetical protein
MSISTDALEQTLRNDPMESPGLVAHSVPSRFPTPRGSGTGGLTRLRDKVPLLLFNLTGGPRCAPSLSRNRLHVLANDFIVAGFGIQIISPDDEHVAPVAEREHSFVREANADVDDSI